MKREETKKETMAGLRQCNKRDAQYQNREV